MEWKVVDLFSAMYFSKNSLQTFIFFSVEKILSWSLEEGDSVSVTVNKRALFSILLQENLSFLCCKHYKVTFISGWDWVWTLVCKPIPRNRKGMNWETFCIDMSSGQMFFYHGGKLSVCALALVFICSFWRSKIKEERVLKKHAFDLNTATIEYSYYTTASNFHRTKEQRYFTEALGSRMK